MATKARDCKLDHAVQIEPGLLSEFPENGNIPRFGWRLSTISRESCHFYGRGDARYNARNPYLAGFSRYSCEPSQVERVLGWQRSADRTRLHLNSLQTGNFTGKITISGLKATILKQKTTVPQGLLANSLSKLSGKFF
jgi:hypothetical protein